MSCFKRQMSTIDPEGTDLDQDFPIEGVTFITSPTMHNGVGVSSGGLMLSHLDFQPSTQFSIVRSDDTDPFLEVRRDCTKSMQDTNRQNAPSLASRLSHLEPNKANASHTLQDTNDNVDEQPGSYYVFEGEAGSSNRCSDDFVKPFRSTPKTGTELPSALADGNGVIVAKAKAKRTDILAKGENLVVEDPFKRGQYQTPSSKIQRSFTRYTQGGNGFTTPRVWKPNTSFTPLIKQTEYFGKHELPSPIEDKGYKEKKKVVLYAFSEEYAQSLLKALPEDSDYEIEVIRKFGRIQDYRIPFQTPTTPTRNRTDRTGGGLRRVVSPHNPLKGRVSSDFEGTTLESSQAFPNQFTSALRPSQLGTSAQLRPKIRFLVTQKAPTTFILFPKLPIELQLMVLEHALPGPRKVHMTISKDNLEFRPFLSPVPPILQVCQVSRELALKRLHQRFHTATRPHAYNYFNPLIDTLKLSLHDAKRLALISRSSIKRHREMTRHVEIVFPIFWKSGMWRAMAELVLSSPHRAWPSIESWCFPGAAREGKPAAARKEVVALEVRRPVSVNDGENAQMRLALAGLIGERMAAGRREYGVATQVGILITYS